MPSSGFVLTGKCPPISHAVVEGLEEDHLSNRACTWTTGQTVTLETKVHKAVGGFLAYDWWEDADALSALRGCTRKLVYTVGVRRTTVRSQAWCRRATGFLTRDPIATRGMSA